VFSKEDEMSRTQLMQHQAMGTIITTVAMVLGGAFLIVAMMNPAHAQAFADRNSALVDYSKAELEPSEDCMALGNFKSADIADHGSDNACQ
jgi:hypothetical protein